jgi:acetylornithine deacetylase/succinyl-diaminopimelate desuccinylase-like protein
MAKTEADYLEELVAFPSITSDKEALKKCARFCVDFFKSRGLYTELIESEGYPNVMATTRKVKRPKVLLQCHMDVVPAKDELFTMKRDGGKLTGRGAFDMKFACASYMKLLDELGDDIGKYDFGIMLSFDEEIGGRKGVEALLKQGYGSEVCILPDSGKNWRLETSAHGAWFVRLSKIGKNAHGSLPKNGVNAAEILTQAINDLNKLRREYSDSELSLSLTQINSGKAMNQIPDYAEAVLDIRFKNDSLYQSLKTQIEKVCSKYKIEVNNIELFPCVNIDTKEAEITEFIRVAEGVLGGKISTGHSEGSTDARYFCANNIPCIVIQPNGGGRHSDNEWVDAKGLQDLTAILLKFITKHAII